MTRLGEVATYINGFAFKPDDWSEEGLPIIRIQDLTGNSYQMNRYAGDYNPKYEVNRGDVLISWSASLGVYVWQGEKALLNQHIFKVVFDKCEVDRSFYVHQVAAILEKAANQAHGATMKHLTKPVFDALPFYLPDLPTQQRIADTLDKVSEGIGLCRKMLGELDLMVKAKFVEMLETDYSEKTATEVCTAIVDCPHSTPTYSGCELLYPAIRTSEISNGEINWNSMKYVSADEYRMRVKKLMPQPGDIVYAREGTYGDCVILPAGFSFCLGQRTMLFRPNIDIANPIYLHQVLRSNYVKRQADKSNTGSTVPHVNVADAKQFHFPLPPIEVQNRFADFSTKINESKLTIRGILDKMETEKLALMQEYFG